MKRYQSYKSSGVEWIGEIPKHWDKRKFKFLFREKRSTSNLSLSSGSISFGEVIYKDDEGIPEERKETYQEVLKGEFLINPLNLNFDLKSLRIGLSDIDVVVSPGYIVLILNNDNNKGYFKYILRTFDTQQMKSLGNGVRQTISFNHLSSEELVLPPLKEQIQIVQYLDEKTELIDKLISTKERKITLLKEQRTSLINQVVTKGLNPNIKMKDTGVEWIGEIPEHWEIKRTSYLCTDMMSGPFGSSLKKEFYTKKGYKIYGQEQVIDDDFSIGDYYISEEKFNELKRCEIFTNEILISCVGTFGKISLVPKEFERGIINPRLLKISPNELLINPKYFLILLRSNISFSQFECYSRGGTMGVINLEILKQLKFSIPPIKEQVEIIQYIEIRTKEMDDLIHLEQKKIDLLKEYRQSLISEVVTGKIKVTTDE
jgi:type I restriction enzyme S subunit